MKHLLFSLSRFVVVFLSSSLVFFALVVLTARLFTPFLSHHAQTIERFTSDLLHKPVKISQFRVTWQGLEPILQGEHVTIWNDERTQPLLQIKQLDIGIALFKTLLTGRVQLEEVKVHGMDLLIRQIKNNQFTFNGLSTLFKQDPNDTGNGIKEAIEWLLAEQKLSLQAINLIYDPLIGPKWPNMRLNVLLENKKNRHQLSAQLQFLEEKPSTLILIADATGPFSQQQSLANLKGRVYVQGQSILLDRWLALLKKNFSIQNGIANFAVWTDWQQNNMTQMHILMANTETSKLQIEKQPVFTLLPFSTNFVWQSDVNKNWDVNATVQNLSFLAWEKIPGIKGLNAYVHITPTSGKLITRSKNVVLDFMKLFKAPIQLDSLSSELRWQQTNNGVLIQVPKFDASNEDVSVNGQMGLLMSANHKNPEISLLAHVKTENPSRIAYYLPLPFTGPELVHWLNGAIVKGSGDASVLLQGSLSEFPYDKNDGTFLIDTQIKNAELHYESAWPNLQQINGDLLFSGRQMQMLVNSAQIFGTALKNIRANIPLIKTHVQAVLHIAAEDITTRLENGLAFLQATPLAKEMGGLAGVTLNGPLKLALQLIIPLESGKEKLKIVGLGTTENAKALIPSHNIQIDNLKGQFSLSQAGVEGKNLIGLLWNKPITIGIRSAPSTQLAINYDGIQTLLNPEKNGWRFLINNKTAQGSVLVPNGKGQAIEANFDSIYLTSTSSAQSEWSLKQIPKINLRAKDVRYNEMDFGTVQLQLRPILAGVSIKEFQAGNSSYHLIASGAWHRQEKKLTEFIGQLDSPNLSGFLQSWGLPASITAEQAHIRFNLQWSGAPYDVNLAKLRGNFSFTATNGQIVDIGSSAEAKLSFGRLLTFLSLQSLGRRLQLDFSDLKAKGFDFTSLQGHFSLRDGNAFTRDVEIEGPVAAIAITGRIGLQAKDYDLTIKVVPHFTSSLPVIVGLAGGPIAGAITWVANAVLGSTVQKIAETSYHITGSWGKPEVVKTST
ncbi:MAG: AsmA-like C-terminal region-containing protein [Pseudomonadota bacterium]